MYLKRLEIQGFKSFANKTVLDFMPPRSGRFSVTAVVGPNGSGKSNVVDAIRWVMGETSMKNLRGKKSEDVIFGGSETKGQMSAAEVSLILDNADGRAGVDYPEIAITRRFYRSGEGEYLVNGNSVRLLDIHLLLAKAQFAEHAYSIVGQGMIDRLLTVGPLERKDFLDEASGIKEFQIKQHQAQLKLARTAENMEQARRLLVEVEPRLKLLARQVKKLEKRQEVELSLRESQERYYATLYTRHKNENDELSRRLLEVEANYREAFARLETVQTELSAFARAQSRQEVFTALQSRHEEAMKAKNDLERELAILDGRLTSEYREAGKGNIGWMEQKIKELKFARGQITGQLDAARAELSRLRAQMSEANTKIEKLSVEKTEKAVQISRLQFTLMQNQSEQNFYQFSGLSTVRAVLEARENWGGKIFGLAAELGEVEEKYRTALDTAAGNNLSSIVVENDEAAKRAIEYLRQRRLGVATFLPLNKIQPRTVGAETDEILKERDVIGRALDLVKFSSKFELVFQHILGDTVVVKDLAAAQRIGIGRIRMVTLDGDLVEKRGVMKGGWRNRAQNLSFAMRLAVSGEERAREFQAQIGLEQQNLAEIERQLDAARAVLSGLEVDLNTAENKIVLQAAEEQNLARETGQLEKELESLQVSPEQYGEMLARLSEEKTVLMKKMEIAERALQKIGAEIADFNQKEEEKKQRVFSLQTEMQYKQNEVNNVLSARNDLKVEIAKLETKLEDLNEEVKNETGSSAAAILERNPATVATEALPELANSIQKLKYQLSLIGGIDEDVTAEYGQTKEKYDFLTGQLTDLEEATADLEKMIEELDALMKTKRAAAFKKIQKEFDRYFKILFGGGTARLEEIYGEPPSEEAEDLPDRETAVVDGQEPTVAVSDKERRLKEKVLTGIDVIASPPGKKIKNLSALSGGERTLTSIALICAVLNNNPSPFVVLDEVEAALDEANTMRFAKIMAELSAQSQFVIITHNRVTMHHADALYGVTMGPDGVSKLLSVKLSDVPAYEEAIDKK